MKRIIVLLLSIVIVFPSMQASEQRFDWRAYLPSSTMSMVWPLNAKPIWAALALACGYSFFKGRTQTQKAVKNKQEFLQLLKPYVALARDENFLGSADDVAKVAANDSTIIRLLPVHLAKTHGGSRQAEVMKQRVGYLRSDAIWGEVEKSFSKTDAFNNEMCNLTVEAEEYNRLRALRAFLPELLAPAAKQMHDEQAKQSRSTRNMVEAAAEEGSELAVDHEWELSPDTWHKKYIKQGFEGLGFKAVQDKDIDAIFNEYYNAAHGTQSLWGDACAVAGAKGYKAPHDLKQLVEKKLKESQQQVFETDKLLKLEKISLEAQQINRHLVHSYYRQMQQEDIENRIKQKESFKLEDHTPLMDQRYRVSWYLYPFALMAYTASLYLHPFMPVIFNGGVAKKRSAPWFFTQAGKDEADVRNQMLKLGSEFKRDEDPQSGAVSQEALRKRLDLAYFGQVFVFKNLVQSEFFNKVISSWQKDATDGRDYYLRNLGLAFDSFNKLVKNPDACDEIKKKRAIVTQHFETYLANKDDKEFYANWKYHNDISTAAEYHFKAFYNAHEELARAVKELRDFWRRENIASSDMGQAEQAGAVYDDLKRCGIAEPILNYVFECKG